MLYLLTSRSLSGHLTNAAPSLDYLKYAHDFLVLLVCLLQRSTSFKGKELRGRPVPCAHLWGNALTPPAPGDHKGPPFPTSSALAPTDHPASSLSSRLGLMPIRSPNRVSSHRAPCEAVSHVVIGALIMRGMRRRDIQRRIAPK